MTIDNDRGWNMVSLRTYWFLCMLGLASLEVLGQFFHASLIPARWNTTDLFVSIPVVLCIAIGAVSGRTIGWRSWAAFGAMQAGTLLHVFADHYAREIRFGNGHAVVAEWLMFIVVYAAVFTVIVQLLVHYRRTHT